MKYFEMDDVDRAIVAKAREALAYDDNGDPVRDVVDESDMVDAMRLLVLIVDGGYAK